MADCIKVSTDFLISKAQELVSIQDAISDAENILAHVNLSNGGGGEIHVSMNDRLRNGAVISGNDVTTILHALCAALRRTCDDAGKITKGVLRAAELFEQTENSLLQARLAQPRANALTDFSPPHTGIDGRVVEQGPGLASEQIRRMLESFFRRVTKRRIKALFQDGRFDRAAWEAADLETRKRMLSELIRQINSIFKTEVTEDIDYFDPQSEPSIYEERLQALIAERNEMQKKVDQYREKLNDESLSEGARRELLQIYNMYLNELRGINEQIRPLSIITNGEYDDKNRQVRINNRLLQNGSYEDVMEVLVHEMRHAYQHEAIRNPQDSSTSNSTLKDWQQNFDHYIDPRKGNGSYDDYRNQPVEKDAFSFADDIAAPESDSLMDQMSRESG